GIPTTVDHVYVCLYLSSFFFSSRRRHTRFKCDWSSDVCSSDLRTKCQSRKHKRVAPARLQLDRKSNCLGARHELRVAGNGIVLRSEERRVGKECRDGGGVEQYRTGEEKKWAGVDTR